MAAPTRTYLEIRGERLSLRQIAERYDLPYEVVRHRYHAYGFEGEALIRPQLQTPRYEVRGELLSMAELVEKYNLNRATLEYRVRQGWTGEQLIASTGYTRIDHETRALLDQIHAETGIPLNRLRMRYRRGSRGQDLRKPVLKVGRPAGVKNKPRAPEPETPVNPAGHVEVHQFTNEKDELRFELRLVIDGMIKCIERSTRGAGYLSTGTAINSASRLFRGYPIK